MILNRNAIVAAALAVLLGTAAMASDQPIKRSHNPRLVGTALLINLVYFPTRLALTAVGAVLGGLTGLLSMGNLAAAESIWGLSDGSMIVTPEMLEGTEEFHFSAYD